MSQQEELYRALHPLLIRLGERRFGLQPEEAEALVHDVFVSYVRMQRKVKKPRPYVVSAFIKRCCSYWRKQARIELGGVPDTSYEPQYVPRLVVERVLRALPPKQRHVLVLRYVEGRTVADVARILRMSVGGTEKLIRRALEAAAAAASDETERCGAGAAAARKDTCAFHFPPRRIIRAHVRRLRGAAVPRTPSRAAVVSARGRSARQVPRELPRAARHLQTSRGYA